MGTAQDKARGRAGEGDLRPSSRLFTSSPPASATAPPQETEVRPVQLLGGHETGSARMRLELARLNNKAIRWKHTAAGRSLVDVLADIANEPREVRRRDNSHSPDL